MLFLVQKMGKLQLSKNQHVILRKSPMSNFSFMPQHPKIKCSIGGKEPTFKVAANRNAPVILPPSVVRRVVLHHKFGLAIL